MNTDAIRRLSGIVRAAKFIQTEEEGVSLYGSCLRKLADEQDAVLTALEAENVALREALEQAREWANRIAGDERVCGWVHGEDYGLYCLLADCGVDFEAALASAPSDKRLVPLDKLREIQWVLIATRVGIEMCVACKRSRDEGCADDCWLTARIRGGQR